MESFRGITLVRKGTGQEMVFHPGDVPYFTVAALDRLGIKNGFSTRFGGVSEGFYAEMDLSCTHERPEIYRENYRRMLKNLQMNVKTAVLTSQTHTVNVRIVTEKDQGKGPFLSRDYDDVDGLVTDLPDVPLVTLHADCVPLYFVDPVKKVIGLSHAGWRGTLHDMAGETLKVMKESFGTHIPDVVAAIGPSICGDCYEVGEDVKKEAEVLFSYAFCRKVIREDCSSGKFYLDLQEANRLLMIRAGVSGQNISVTDICTRCNPDLLFSHRVHGKKRGLMGAFLSL